MTPIPPKLVSIDPIALKRPKSPGSHTSTPQSWDALIVPPRLGRTGGVKQHLNK
jgi:hypothetical protein